MSNELVVVGESRELATMENAPEAVLAEAQKAAAALQDVIKRKPRPVVMGGEQYLEFEDWQTLARFYGLTAGEEQEPEFVNLDGVKGFKATAVALLAGRVVSRATAYCLNDEEKWLTRTKYEYHMVLKNGETAREEDSDKGDWVWEPNPNKPGGKRPQRRKVAAGEESVPLYQLASMAQTRANAKVLRNVLSWVAVLAGYKPTPAEEMDGVKAPEKAPAQKAAPREPGEDDAPSPPSKTMTCKFCDSPNITASVTGKTAKCDDCGKGWNVKQ
jgi:hypothetical protein